MNGTPLRFRWIALVPAAMALTFMACESGPPVELAIINANVIPMDSERVLEDRTVLVDSGRIVAIGIAAEVHAGHAGEVIDAMGGYLVPGLADMHVHISSEKDLVPYVANGVTLVRNMWGSPAVLDERRRVEEGELLGPTIITAGPLVDGDPPIWDGSAVARTPEDGRRIVREQMAEGYDFIKVYSNLRPEVFEAIIAEAKAAGIPVAGHVPQAVPLEEALRAGMASIEHLIGFNRAVQARPMPADLHGLAAIARDIAAGRIAWSEIYDSTRAAAVIRLAAASGTWQVPTLIVNKRIVTSRRRARALLDRPATRYMSPAILASWNPDTDFRLHGVSDDELEAIQVFFPRLEERVLALHDAGVGILAGTDAPNPHVLYGFSLHEELALVHESGLTNYETLVTTTRAPAEFLHQSDEFGTLEVGKRADMVLVRDNPLVDLSVLDEPVAIVLRGVWHSRAELQAALEDVAASYAPPTDWFAGIDPMVPPPSALPPSLHQIAFNGSKIGAIRAQIGSGTGGRAFTAQVVQNNGELIRNDCTVQAGAGAVFDHASCTQYDPRGEHHYDVSTADGRIVLSGTAADGSAIADEAAVDGSPLVLLAPRVPGLSVLAAHFANLSPGKRVTANVVTLDNENGGFHLRPEAWTIEAAPSDDGRRVLRIAAGAGPSAWNAEVELDGMLVTRAAFRYQMGVVTLEQSPH